MRPKLWATVGVITLLWPAMAGAHLIDEIAQSIVLDIQTQDRATFTLTFALHDSHVEAFYSQARQVGIAAERSDHAFAAQLAGAFAFKGCLARPLPVPAQVPQPGFRSWKVALSCSTPQQQLTVRRVDYRRDKTRTTVFIGLRVGARKARRFIIPPRMPGLTLPLEGGATVQPVETTAKPDPHDEHQAESPDDLPDFPDPEQASANRTLTFLRPPPLTILKAWVHEGAMHLATGADHLLFLLALVLCATRGRWLVFAVFLFSIGHLVAMATALTFRLPGHVLVEIGVGASIVWAGWTARRGGGPELRTHWGVVLFGLIHGWAFGSELGRLALGADGLLWPLLAFGVGLDVAQLLWCLVAWLVVGAARSRLDSGENPDRVTAIGSLLVIAGGAVFAVVAALG